MVKVIVDDLERVLKPGGYWFIKMNPYYSKEELESFEYKNAGNNIYEKDHIMRLRQATTSNGVQGVQTRLKRKDRFESK